MFKYMVGCSLGASAARPPSTDSPIIATQARINGTSPDRSEGAVVARQPWLKGERGGFFRAGLGCQLGGLCKMDAALRLGAAPPRAVAGVLPDLGPLAAGQ